MGEILHRWLTAPGALIGPWFRWIHMSIALTAAALVAFALPLKGRPAEALLAILIAVELWHFSPRVRAHTVEPGSFDPPPTVRFLIDKQEQSPVPFRIAGFDPFRFHHTEMDSLYKSHYLMSNLATIHGLDDISGFDPLIPVEYKRLFERTSGIPTFNDPIRHLDPARPDEELFAELNVRYLIGNPYDRRFTQRPIGLTGQSPRSEVTGWNEEVTTSALTAWNFVSLVDGAATPQPGEPIAELVIQTDDGTEFAFPVRYGIETGHIYEDPASIAEGKTAANMQWERYPGPPARGYRSPQTNYRATIEFGRPLRAKRVRWRLLRDDLILFVPAQGYRVEAPQNESRWRKAFEGSATDVYEFVGARPRAEVRGGYAIEEGRAATDASGRTAGLAEIVARSANGVELNVVADAPALLILRESWAPGWLARVDGKKSPLLQVDGIFRGVEVPAGRHRVEFDYAPPLFYLCLLLSAAAMTATTALWNSDRKRGR